VPVQKTTNSVNDLFEKFAGRYGIEAQFVQSPGRVNLIGEHTDYNDGFVLLAAIPFQTTVGIAPRTGQRLALFSENCGERVEFDPEHFPEAAQHH
jgi:galactokinase